MREEDMRKLHLLVFSTRGHTSGRTRDKKAWPQNQLKWAGHKGGRGIFVSGAMSYYARKKFFAWGIG